ncbi:MAG: fibronectin type III domain-containing protein [Kiritimatiellae bacterium]|nr:fibronectin type III domain-containing protein [Kiritimatiellia bacterium]
MRKMRGGTGISILCGWLTLGVAGAATIQYDEFDAGGFTANPTGVGLASGWRQRQHGTVSASESDGSYTVSVSSEHASHCLIAATEADEFNFWNSAGATVTWVIKSMTVQTPHKYKMHLAYHWDLGILSGDESHTAGWPWRGSGTNKGSFWIFVGKKDSSASCRVIIQAYNKNVAEIEPGAGDPGFAKLADYIKDMSFPLTVTARLNESGWVVNVGGTQHSGNWTTDLSDGPDKDAAMTTEFRNGAFLMMHGRNSGIDGTGNPYPANTGKIERVKVETAGGAPVPAAPSGLTATASSSSRIDVSWTDNSDNETGFKVDRRQSGTTEWVRIATPGANAMGHTDSGLAAETKYYYKVKAYNGQGDSEEAGPAYAVTSAPMAEDKIPRESVWRYRRGTAEASTPAAAWCRAGFDDSGWSAGPAPFGYKVGGGWSFGTTVNDMYNGYACLFLRKTFTLANPSAVRALLVEIEYDDGFVAWLNGEEIGRVNVPGALGSAVPAATLAAGYVSDPPAQWSISLSTADMPALAMTNVLAIQVLNNALGSGDLSLDARVAALEGGLLAGSVDADDDEMDDGWENAWLGGTDVPNGGAADDLDGDGVPNGEEFVAGTDPGDGSKFFAAAIRLVAGEPVVSFVALAAAGTGYAGLARYYTLQEQAGMDATAWTDVSGKVRILGQGQTVSQPAASDRACYRVRAWLE